MKNKKVLWISLAAVDVAVVAFLFVMHVLMLVNVFKLNPAELQVYVKEKGLFPYLAGHLNVYGFAFVIPTALILALNIVGLVLYLKKSSSREKITAKDLSEEEKEALKKELLKELNEK